MSRISSPLSKKKGPETGISGPSCRRVQAFDGDVVARPLAHGPVLFAAADGCSIFGKSSVFVTRAVGSCALHFFARLASPGDERLRLELAGVAHLVRQFRPKQLNTAKN